MITLNKLAASSESVPSSISSTPTIAFLEVNNLENFYSDPVILTWLNRYNIPINQKTLGRVPLGNIIDKNNYDWNNIMQNNKVIKLKLHE